MKKAAAQQRASTAASKPDAWPRYVNHTRCGTAGSGQDIFVGPRPGSAAAHALSVVVAVSGALISLEGSVAPNASILVMVIADENRFARFWVYVWGRRFSRWSCGQRIDPCGTPSVKATPC